MGKNRDFDARYLEEGRHCTICMNYKLKILAKRGNRSNLRIVLLQRKPQIIFLFFIYLSIKGSRCSRGILESFV